MTKVAAPPPSSERMRRTIADAEMRSHLSAALLRILTARRDGWAAWILRAEVTEQRRREAVRNLAAAIYRDLVAALEEEPARTSQSDKRDIAPTTVGGTDG